MAGHERCRKLDDVDFGYRVSRCGIDDVDEALDVLDTRSLVWGGDLWPGQRATIAFEEERDAGEAANDVDDVRPPSSWRIRITLDLPSLGCVQATLDLQADTLDLALAAVSTETQTRLTSAKAELAASLADAKVAWPVRCGARSESMTMERPDPPASAVALRYAEADAAPVVIAKGRGAVADEIVRRAHEAGVFVHGSRELVTLLMQVNLDARIPPALYLTVAELLGWLAHVDSGGSPNLKATER